MREIEFRAKHTWDNEFVYGYLVYIQVDNSYRITQGKEISYFVKADTIGQYTGLKDKNGTKIFEGDIIQLTRTKMRAPTASFNGQDIVSKHLIYWDEERHAFRQKHYTEERCIGGGSIDFERAEENIIEVIGNIHDNPELLLKGIQNG